MPTSAAASPSRGNTAEDGHDAPKNGVAMSSSSASVAGGSGSGAGALGVSGSFAGRIMPVLGAVTAAGLSASPSKAGVNNGTASSSGFAGGDMDEDTAVLAYLRRKGFNRIEQAFKAELEAVSRVQGTRPGQTGPASAAEIAAATAAAAAETGGLPSLQPIALKELAHKNAPRDMQAASKGLGGASSAADTGTPGTGGPAPGEVDAAEALARDPTDTTRGFSAIKNWCEGSLEVYQVELRPLLLPLFVHSYLNLVDGGYGDAAGAFFSAFSHAFMPTHTVLISQIRAVALPHHLASDSLAVRFRTERYIIKVTQTTFSLLLGWLTDGLGPVSGAGAADGLALDEGEGRARRARDVALRILNERCRIQVLQAKPYELDPAVLEEGVGLTGIGPSYAPSPLTSVHHSSSSSHPSRLGSDAVTGKDAVADYNASAAGPQLKLHPRMPMSDRLQVDVAKELELQEWSEKQAQKQRLLKAKHEAEGTSAAGAEDKDGQTSTDGAAEANADVLMTDATKSPSTGAAAAAGSVQGELTLPSTAPASSAGLLAPVLADLAPQPPTYRTVDVNREVARILDARKALRFDLALESGVVGQGFLSGVRDPTFNGRGEEGAKAARAAAMPSVCAYTYHDADDGLTCSVFSHDTSMMAAGFEESYVQVWSLKGETLRGLRSDFDLSEVRDAKTLKKVREREGRSTRKLIGHSGPVYSVDFDPIGGSASAPKHLLSSSADGTTRLWSLETFSALVAYRGHNLPVWNVKWGPQGIYFATASADKTARLWSTERINPLRIYAGHLSDVDCLDFHPNSLYLATGSSDRTCRLWDVQRGTCLRLFVGHTSSVSCVKISPDGRYLASAGTGDGFWTPSTAMSPKTGPAGDDTGISLWDLASGRRIKKMWGHTATVHDLDFSSDGNLLVSGGADCTVRCWDVKGPGGRRRVPADGSVEAQQMGAMSGSADATKETASAGVSTSAKATGSTGTENSYNWLQQSSADCVATFYTKQTPLVNIKFTPRNLCMVAGAYDPTI
ncbi:WD40 repeat-like protein [Tilletiaria anomala UBC 951]|uniref:WD40 repeat-like protein n=1 Tax=Tilletiaria anomala (strain ATCC 24038 / CBS 436.72 / UBC 951) TaxID=1037660 RepID=A0A066VWM2_TILAU|nr:WD40 repeat-like protein [Tilletiaria anomala UBC 951]KDN43214.1 WD40 repeat-like protein [Tilletiaria anomala UBC 951]